MTIFGGSNVRKHREIKDVEQYIILEIYYNIGCMEKREVTYSESKYNMGRTGKVLTTYLYFRTKRPNKKQKERFSTTDINKQDFRKFLKKFENSTYLGYRNKQVHNETTES